MSVPGSIPVNRKRRGWTAARIIAAIGGVVLVLCAIGLVGTGTAAAWLSANRDGGYVDLDNVTAHTDGYALSDPTIVSDEMTTSDGTVLSWLGTARVRVTAIGGTGPIFVGIAPSDKADAYLSGVDYATFRDTAKGTVYTAHTGAALTGAPAQQTFWIAQASGTGSLTLVAPAQGKWTIVAFNADGSRQLSVQVYLDATFPALPVIAAVLVLLGAIFLVGGLLLIVIPLRRARARAR
jgi:hypothetical protein